ncbi:protein mono-ADP-ribosyltransferase PARP12-like isoform X2 [Struthio camelus]|uniref:protein mono-ADP-ribosyltransferase PARP12-like isoform X2 n=1 Tax=Struthio camelus TaxID=8801 RepID=UPI003603FBF8
MSDPAVCSFLTKTLCAQGGWLGLAELQQHVGLSAQQLEQTLAAAGPERFLVLRGDDTDTTTPAAASDAKVLALSAVRLCVRKECGGCERLHLCKLYLMGKCNLGARACKYCHDINTAGNKKVLKNHELSGLNEYELRVLLLQNDPFLLPDVCQFYNQGKGTCAQQNNCNKLHVCRHFLRGGCRFLPCKRSHNLLNTHELHVLEAGGIDLKTASKFQTICDHKHVEFSKELKKAKSSSSNAPGQNQHQQPTGAGDSDKGKKDDSSVKDSKDNKVDKCDEICLFYVWKYCKHNDSCRQIHYHLPYRWQVYNGITWNDLSMMEEIEKAYCDPKNNSIADRNINFQTMTCGSSSLRRLSTPSSVTKPTFVLTTQWIWYWKDDQDQWIEYGGQGEGGNMNSLPSDILENLYLADPDATIPFQTDLHCYELNFKEMIQTNTRFRTRRQVCRRPKFVSSEDVDKIKKGQRDSSIPNQTCPAYWDQSALPELGYKQIAPCVTAILLNPDVHAKDCRAVTRMGVEQGMRL